MSIRTIRHDEAISTLRRELVYTAARLKADGRAKELAAQLSPLVTRSAEVAAAQLAAWDAEEEAAAQIDAADDALDDAVDAVDRALLHVERGERGSTRHRRYFAHPRNEIVRLGIENELARVREWPASLANEPEAELKQAGQALAAAVVDGESAVRARAEAAAARADHRVREIARFIDDVNAVRRSLYGLLVQRGAEAKLPADWPNRFFKRTHHAAKGAGAAG